MAGALLLIDMQRDFLQRPDLRPRVDRLVRRAGQLLDACRAAGVPVIHVRTTIHRDDDQRMTHWRLAGRWMCVAGTPGHEPPDALREREGERVIHKHGYSAAVDGELGRVLRDVECDTLIIAGVHAHACVRAAAMDALGAGLRVVIADDAVGGYDAPHAAITRRFLAERSVAYRSTDAIAARLTAGESPAGGDGPYVHRDPRDARRVLFEVADADGAAVDAVVGGCVEAAATWRQTPMSTRGDLLLALADRIERDGTTLTRLMVEQIAKPAKHASAEVALGAAFLRESARHATDVIDESVRPGVSVRHAPLGVVAAITPWNNPVAVPLGKIGPALLWGNAVVWKPAPAARLIAERIGSLMADCGVPARLVGVLHGGAATAQRLAAHVNVDAVTLTGSIEAGHALGQVAAGRHVPYQGELGGNNAAIVWSDADLAAAARSIASAAFGFAGQRCTANRRVIVDEAVADIVLDHLVDATRELTWGDPADAATDVGPVISTRKRDALLEDIADARARGNRVITPHTDTVIAAPCGHGLYVPPTIVCCDAADDRIVCDESFGPILVVQRARDFDHAMTLLNGVEHGLAASLYSVSAQRRDLFRNGARVGILRIGQPTTGADPSAPFGGWKASGVGPPEHGAFDRLFFTRPQAVYDDRNDSPGESPQSR